MASSPLPTTLTTPTALIRLTLDQMERTAAILTRHGLDDIVAVLAGDLHGYGPTGRLVIRGGWTVWAYDPNDGEPEGVGAQPTRPDDQDLIRPGTRIICRNASAFEVTRIVRDARANTPAA